MCSHFYRPRNRWSYHLATKIYDDYRI